MAEILLTSEAFIKSVTAISDNVAGKFMLPAMREAQENGLRQILGDALTVRLKGMVSDGSITASGNAMYKELLDRCQYYLAYRTLVEVAFKVSYKISNFGVSKTTDENMQVASEDEIARSQKYYGDKADACCRDLQGWILDNRTAFPELDDNTCHRMRSHLTSAASCGVWLGGPRGKVRRRRCR